ncbi:PfkB family carbohydrate kinase [Nocardioides sp.]|uniref:PfkB family carbohydrate kinase n=1 Tax=Nocardioides sp. TaxID=35761 RepID=UPI0027369D90|nr:PfkB family carbohydrate kinase [Nocardioides sp.]MDP3893261.1 PfkB family carbohydrate kinase [Nocardioides sp.]
MHFAALVIGEALVDVVHDRDGSVVERPGGSAANVAVALARLDRPVWFATSHADDEHGRMVADHLRSAGVELGADPGVVDATSAAVATIDGTGAATYDFSIDWRLGELDVPADVHPLVLHVCSYSAVLLPGAAAVQEGAERWRGSATLTYDINMRPAVTGAGPEVVQRVERLVALADVVKASDEDLAVLYRADSEADAAARLLALGPAAVIVTRGGEGATAVTEHGIVEVSADRATVADTIGAGDTFGAAVIDALWQRELLGAAARQLLRDAGVDEWRGILEHAARAAAITVSRPGADPPYRDELA